MNTKPVIFDENKPVIFALSSLKLSKSYIYKISPHPTVYNRFYVYLRKGKRWQKLGRVHADVMRLAPSVLASTSSNDYRMIEMFIDIINDRYPWPASCEFSYVVNCQVCGRPLTSPQSIKAGIGPECIKKSKC